MPHVKRTRNASVSYPPDFIPGGLSNCRGARSHEHFDSLERVAGRLTRVLGDEGDDANRTSYRVIGGRPDYAGPAVRILPRTGARVYLSERWKVDDLINNNDRQQQQLKLTLTHHNHSA